MTMLLGDNAGTVLLNAIEQIERTDGEIRELQTDKSEIYKSLKGHGFDTKVVKLLVSERRMEAADLTEQSALLDSYRSAVDAAKAGHSKSTVHARARDDNKVSRGSPNSPRGKGEAAPGGVGAASPDELPENVDPETGEITEPEPEPEVGAEESEPVPNGEDAGEPGGESATPSPAPSAADPEPEASVEPPEPSSPEASDDEDLLDIPDFLQRSA